MATTFERIQLNRKTAAQWTASNIVLLAGEAGVETDTHKVKFGDGTTTWAALPYAGDAAGVATVNGRAGTVTLTAADVGLSNVTNTSDANKPVSTAQAAALAAKMDYPPGGVNGQVPMKSGSTVAWATQQRGIPYGATAPDHTIYPVWCDTSVTPPAMKWWDGSAWTPLTGATPPQNPLFVYDYQTGDRTQWPAYNAVNVARQITVANNVLPQRSTRFPYTARFEVDPALDVHDPGNFRAEVAQDASTGLGVNPAGGDVRWLSWSTYFPADFVHDGSWFVFTQMRPMQSGSSPLLGFEVANIGGVPWIQFFCNGGAYTTTYQYQSGGVPVHAINLGAWNDLLVKVVWSADPTVGEVTVWHNGVLAVNAKKAANLIPTYGTYLKQGIYCADNTTVKHVLGHTGMRVGLTQADVSP